MAQRYGRNQRRKHRERIAELERAHQLDAALLNRQRQEIGQYQSWANRINRVVPKYSILNKETVEERRLRDPGPEERVAEITRPSTIGIFDPIDPTTEAFQLLRMNIARVEARPEDYRRGLRYRLSVGGDGKNDVMYAIDDDLIRMKEYDEEFLYWTSEQIAKNMIQYLKQG